MYLSILVSFLTLLAEGAEAIIHVGDFDYWYHLFLALLRFAVMTQLCSELRWMRFLDLTSLSYVSRLI